MFENATEVCRCLRLLLAALVEHIKRSVLQARLSWGQSLCKVGKGAKIRNRYNQVPYLTQDTNGKVTNSQLDTTNESQEVSPFQQVTTKHI